MATETWRLGRRPGLDGLRGVAVLLVVICHLGDMQFGPVSRAGALGSAGVDMFFTLSGFLITSLLLTEWTRSSAISLRAFYARRARRLLPALAAAVAGFWLLGVASGLPLTPHLLPVFLYAGNWASANGTPLGVLAPAWTLAIEEQFYLAWPLALIAILRWRPAYLPRILVGGVVLSTALRIWFFTSGDTARAQFGSDTRASALFVGALLAVAAHQGLRSFGGGRLLPVWVGLAAATQLAWVIPEGAGANVLLAPAVVPLLSAALIWATCACSTGPLTWPWLRYLGRRSYAIYLWHAGILWLAMYLGGHHLPAAFIGLAVVLGVAELSWRWVEAPVLGATTPRSAAPATAHVTTVAAPSAAPGS